jgi:hypothetical protein
MKYNLSIRVLTGAALVLLLATLAAAAEPVGPQRASIPDLSGVYEVLMQGTSSQTGEPSPVTHAQTATLVLFQHDSYLYGYISTGGVVVVTKEELDTLDSSAVAIKLQGLVTATRFWLYGWGYQYDGGNDSDKRDFSKTHELMVWGISGFNEMLTGTFHQMTFARDGGPVPVKIEVATEGTGIMGILRAVKIGDIEITE